MRLPLNILIRSCLFKLFFMKPSLFYFNYYNRKGIRRRGLKFLTPDGLFKTFFFKKKRFKKFRRLQRSRVLTTQKVSRLSSFRNRLKLLSRKIKSRRRSRVRRRITRIRYASDSRFFSRRKFFRKKKGYINTSALLRGESSIFRPNRKAVSFTPFFNNVDISLIRLHYRARRTFLRYKKLFFSTLPDTETLGYRPFSLRAITLYLRSLVLYVWKTYMSNFKFFSRFVKRTSTTFQFSKRFELFRKLKRLRKLRSSSSIKKFILFNSDFSDSISIQLFFTIKKFVKRFFKFSYSFFIRKNYIAEKNKSFFEKFRLKLSTYLALHQSLTLTYYKHFFLNNSFFIRFIPTNSNFFINFGFYDKVIFQLSAGHPVVGFTNSSRSTVPAVTNLVRYFILRLKAFIRQVFPMIFHSSHSNPRSLRRRRLKVPVYYIMEKGIDKRVKVAFKQIRVKSFWRAMGIRFHVPLPHGHTLRAAKRRRR